MNKTQPSKSLAERCFDLQNIEYEVFATIAKILGFDEDRADFDKVPLIDVFWDYYDGSVELIRPQNSEWLTREQADNILGLGFDCIFETIGEEARCWNSTSYSGCHASTTNEISTLKTQNAFIKGLYKRKIQDLK